MSEIQRAQFERVRLAMKAAGLPTNDEAVEVIDAIVDGGREGIAQSPPFHAARLGLRDANVLYNAMHNAHRIAKLHELATEQELIFLRRLKRDAELRMLLHVRPGPDGREWLLPFCGVLLDEWRFLTLASYSISTRGGVTPALEFLEACCQLLDGNVTAETITNKVKEVGGVDRLYEMMPSKEPADAEDQRHAAYVEWCKSEFARKLFEPLT